MVALRWSGVLDDVNVSPINGRVRLGLGPSVPELWGKTILLAPATAPSASTAGADGSPRNLTRPLRPR